MNIRTRHALVVVASVVAIVAAGCGGGGGNSPTVANLGKSGGGSTSGGSTGGGPSSSSSSGRGGGGSMQMQLAGGGTKYAACMRSHGVPNFPDPNADGSISINSKTGIDLNSPKFRAAQNVCEKELPHRNPSPQEEARAQQAALAFSACMRSHGLPKFPDPTFSDGKVSMAIKGTPGSGLDPQSPKFQAAQKACQSKLQKPPGSAGPGPATSSATK